MNKIKEIKCPVHSCVIGRFDSMYGIHNVGFFCRKCKKEYVLTYPPEENKTKKEIKKVSRK